MRTVFEPQILTLLIFIVFCFIKSLNGTGQTFTDPSLRESYLTNFFVEFSGSMFRSSRWCERVAGPLPSQKKRVVREWIWIRRCRPQQHDLLTQSQVEIHFKFKTNYYHPLKYGLESLNK